MTDLAAPATTGAPALDRLDRALASGLAWTGLAKWGVQVLSWASTVLVARLLTPTDYGIMGMALVYLGLVQMVSELGLGAALVQRDDLDASQVARLGGLSALIGCGLFALSAALAPLIAAFFREPAVRAVVVVLATSFVLTGLQVVPNSLLMRGMAFRKLAAIEGLEALAQALVTLGLALAGARYWAIVLGVALPRALSTVLLMRARPHRLAWPRDLRALSGALAFGGRVVLSRLTWYAYSNADFAVIGRVLGTGPLGAYTIGWDIASIPIDKVQAVLGRVVLPVLAQVQRDRAAVTRYLSLLSEGLTLLVLPTSVGMALVAPDFVAVVLGSRWQAAIVPLQALSAAVTFRSLNALYGLALMALDETRQTVRVGVALVLVLPAAFLMAARLWGIGGVAVAWLVVYPLISIPLVLVYTLRRVGLPARTWLKALWPALSSAGVMAVVVLMVQAGLRSAPGPLRLVLAVTAGAAAYGGVLLTLHRARARELLAAARALRA